MLGLEYLLLFGITENKIEGLYEGRAVTCAAFPTQLEAEQHFDAWLDQQSPQNTPRLRDLVAGSDRRLVGEDPGPGRGAMVGVSSRK